ncbi:16S rRNA (adenine(1518)-N(6)/adenine(1519)-N(6))-dimethyltransferase RsmA [Pseudoxanthomonas sp. SGD-10]|jgi:dimethyladenosine transferase|uniref:16S rRNA (adenine(1518)-N(6)/adenine(1519)-N(6))- dimethyltransferase RsmA n=1 Tax=unclassified Pseudoxanthomonas TaxID=2645906 RepID=UPI0002FB0377|nr:MULTISPECIES: 16S rRNA (adenine(1518)-N(6)/adenine(1519)-N(6))-dimethyltransferase RsmA [unclassified Pseudoxanthomonas]RRN80858.1 16S rRNA (adenine(1518)-N(6)/adenine(1519)-N(6))-dimethyltransferase RsmA [Pseudoxanthomonas sp. SGD-10]
MTTSHTPKKSLGQNFLHDARYIERIVQAIDPRPGDRVVEIGPGQGALTLPLLRRHGALTVIEFDRDLVGPLADMAAPVGQLEIIHRDVLQVDLTALAGGGRIKLAGNLPYNISSPILFHALDHAAAIRDMVFMLQKEVVDRMGAAPGSKVYGRLSVMLQAYCQVQPLFVVPPGAFRPAPKVDSAVVRLVPRDPATIGIADRDRFAHVVRAAFGQRRKTLRNALRDVCTPEQFEAAGVSADDRAEQVDVAGFVRLANA